MSTPKRNTTVYLYELAWILPSIAIPVGMLAALAVTAFGAGIHLPSAEGRIDPAKVSQTAPFDALGVVMTGLNRYEVRMTAQIWSFSPNEIRVPAGSTVTFITTSRDLVPRPAHPESAGQRDGAAGPDLAGDADVHGPG
jgi:cytochrome c oxidase subunit II